MNYTLPEDLLEVDTSVLVNLLQEASHGRLGETRALKKANQIRESALNTFGITIGTGVFKLQIQLLLEQIQLIEKHLTEIEQRSEEHTSELQSRGHLVCRPLLEKKNKY